MNKLLHDLKDKVKGSAVGPGTALKGKDKDKAKIGGLIREIDPLRLAMTIAWTPLPQFTKQQLTKKSRNTMQPDNALNVEGRDILLAIVQTRKELPLALFRFRKAAILSTSLMMSLPLPLLFPFPPIRLIPSLHE